MAKASIILRVAAVLALLQCIAHGLLHISYSPNHGPAEQALVSDMKVESFKFGGFERTYWGFYFGYGLMVVLTCLVQAVAIWVFARMAASRSREVAPLVALYAVAYALHGWLAWHYFFLKPVLFDVLIAAALSIAAYLAWSDLEHANRGKSKAHEDLAALK
jgi:hypothetical protein